jgi:[acyl-carrier-protein] S-malonyltransferase
MKFAFVFPGQGSQTVGMMDAWSSHPAAMEVIKQASAALGEDLTISSRKAYGKPQNPSLPQ